MNQINSICFLFRLTHRAANFKEHNRTFVSQPLNISNWTSDVATSIKKSPIFAHQTPPNYSASIDCKTKFENWKTTFANSKSRKRTFSSKWNVWTLNSTSPKTISSTSVISVTSSKTTSANIRNAMSPSRRTSGAFIAILLRWSHTSKKRPPKRRNYCWRPWTYTSIFSRSRTI